MNLSEEKTAMSDVTRIDTAGVQLRREAGSIDHFWNVLTDEYFTGEMIPGSRRVRVTEVVRRVRELGLDEGEVIVVYCSGPDCPQSTDAARKLADLGFENVLDYDGGLTAWKEEGHLVEATSAAGA